MNKEIQTIPVVRIVKIPKYKRPKYIIKDVKTGQNYHSLIESQTEAIRLIDESGFILEPDYPPCLWNGEMDARYHIETRRAYGNV